LKALLIFGFIAFFGWQTAFAQSINAVVYEPWIPVRTAGITGGINVASISNLASSDSFLGFHAGLFGEVQSSDDLGYGGEVSFSKQGVTVSNIDFGLNYLSIPLFLNLYSGKVTFQGGGYGSALFLATAKMGQDKKDITDSFQTTDFGLLVGLRYKPGDQTFISARFNLGMQNINNSFTEREDVALRNRNLQISAGYQF
jgi:hypothetical protein